MNPIILTFLSMFVGEPIVSPEAASTLQLRAFGDGIDVEGKRYAVGAGSCAGLQAQAATMYNITQRVVFWRRDCGSDGLNRETRWYVEFLGMEETLVPLDWPDEHGDPRAQGNALYNVQLSPPDGLIRSVRYAHPSRDCGVAETWELTANGSFKLVERREMRGCGMGEEHNWPIIWHDRTHEAKGL